MRFLILSLLLINCSSSLYNIRKEKNTTLFISNDFSMTMGKDKDLNDSLLMDGSLIIDKNNDNSQFFLFLYYFGSLRNLGIRTGDTILIQANGSAYELICMRASGKIQDQEPDNEVKSIYDQNFARAIFFGEIGRETFNQTLQFSVDEHILTEIIKSEDSNVVLNGISAIFNRQSREILRQTYNASLE